MLGSAGLSYKISSVAVGKSDRHLFLFGLFKMRRTVILLIYSGKGVKMVNTHDILLNFSKQVKDILGDKLTKIILYGSYARGDYKENSDIDIMILTTLTDEEIRRIKTDIYDLAFDFQMEYDADINVIVKNEEHFNYWLGALPFYDNVQREGIVLNG